jgi:acrylyl-CoA reductase (NADPH)
MAPLHRRQRAWERLAKDLDPALLETMIDEVPLEGVIDKATALMDGKVRGRVVVRIDS